MVNETLEKLRVLQDILAAKYRVESELVEIPRALSTRMELVQRLKKSYIERNEEYEDTRKRVASLRARMEEAERDREKYEDQMGSINTQREYEALLKEIRDATEIEQRHRKDLQREEQHLEEIKHGLEREESLIAEQEQDLQEEQERIESSTAEKKAELGELESQEKELTPGMDEELLFKFNRIIRSKEGYGIVPIRRGVCTYCNMILPSQFVNSVRKGEDIHFCPYCSLIVFYEDENGMDADEDLLHSSLGLLDDEIDLEDDELEEQLDEEDLELGTDGDDLGEDDDEAEDADDDSADSDDDDEEDDEDEDEDDDDEDKDLLDDDEEEDDEEEDEEESEDL